MNVLVACEFSGIVRDAFIRMGHNAWSCDLRPSESDFGPHYQGDIFEFFNNSGCVWDLMIAHDPCTYQTNCGARWLYEKPGRWELLKESCKFTKRILSLPVKRIVRENPIPHKHAINLIGRKYDQITDAGYFGEDQRKPICLWLKNLPKLIETTPDVDLKTLKQKVWLMPPSPEREKERSRFFLGVANAMADQWGQKNF